MKVLLTLIFSFCLLSIALNSNALLPPRYLSIPDFQRCLGTKNMGTWTAWCIPQARPIKCPQSSWHELNTMNNSGLLQCPKPKPQPKRQLLTTSGTISSGASSVTQKINLPADDKTSHVKSRPKQSQPQNTLESTIKHVYKPHANTPLFQDAS